MRIKGALSLREPVPSGLFGFVERNGRRYSVLALMTLDLAASRLEEVVGRQTARPGRVAAGLRRRKRKNAETRAALLALFEKQERVRLEELGAALGIGLEAARLRMKHAGIPIREGFCGRPAEAENETENEGGM